MTARNATRIAAALLCLAPGAASAYEWRGRVGLAYDRVDTWAPPAPRQSAPKLDVDLRLDVRGDIAGRGVLDYGVGGGYRHMSAEMNGSRSALDESIVYHADMTVLGYMGSPLTLRMYADRSDGAWERSTGETLTGDRVSASYGGTMEVKGLGMPALTLGGTHTENEERLLGAPFHDRTIDTLRVGFNHSTAAFGLDAGFQAEWSGGSWVADEYDSREVNVTGTAMLGRERDFTLVDRYYKRLPTSDAAGAFGTDVNSFRAVYRDGLVPGRTTTLQYADQRSSTVLATDPSALGTTATPVSQQSRTNSLQLRHDTRLPHPEHFVRSIADVSRTDLSRGGVSALQTIGGTIGAELWWRRFASTGVKLSPGVYGSRVYELGGGPLLAVVDTKGLGTEYGYGGAGHARIGVPWRERQVQGTYDVSYSTNAYGQSGWVLQQSGNGSLSGPAGIGGYTLTLSIAAQRSWAPVVGPSASRSVTALARYSWRRYSVQGQASMSNGVLPGTTAFVGDGFFVPVGFDTRQTSAALSATASWLSGISMRADVRYTGGAGPGQPTFSIYEATGLVSYRYGGFQVAIEDRVTTPRIGGDALHNVFLVRLSRTFGSRY